MGVKTELSNLENVEMEARLRESLTQRCKVEVEKSAENLRMADSYSGQTVKSWLDITNRSAILNEAARDMVSHIEMSPGSGVDSPTANHYCESALLKNLGTFVKEGDERKFRPRR